MLLVRFILTAFVCLGFSAWSAFPQSRSTRKKSSTTAKTTTALAPSVKSTPAKASARTRRRSRRVVGQTWTESSIADSTAGDLVDGEDLDVRQAAVQALGPLNGSVVVVDPNTGRVIS